ncbi:hypothetical protein AB0O01_16280 [Streptomyces sp. NPDC093252]|uniref:pPIWI_RE_Y domain-containing protein n=1 Tax=Streptomyces sp. NPDC093252 TaxID=3154980 RepID=UPI00341740BD
MAATARRRSARREQDEAANAGTELFLELARMVAALAETRSLRSFTLPYPGYAQRALDHTVMRCLGIGRRPPRSLPELWEWCRDIGADDELFGVPASLVTPGATLVDRIGQMPTRTCLELASHGAAGGVAAQARSLLDDLEARCGSAERYARCRHFLASHPVVQQEDRRTRGWSKEVWARVKELYRPLPEALCVDGLFLPCPVCGLPALPCGRIVSDPVRPAAGEAIWCEGEDCVRPDRFEPIREPGLALILPRSLRTFLVLPHPVEEAALSELDRTGIEYEAAAGRLGAYHLRGTGSGTREMHVYDRLQPGLLAAHLTDTAPHSDRTFVVVPERLADRDGYRAHFTDALPALLRERLVLTTPDNLVHRLTASAAGGDPDSTADRGGPEPKRSEDEDDA